MKLQILSRVYPPAEDSYFFLDVLEKNFCEIPERILDMGTGTGVLAIASGRKFPEARVLALDIDERAVRCAGMNFQLNGLGKARSYQSDLFERLNPREEEPFDLVLFNPPYLLGTPREKITGQESWYGGSGGTETINRFLTEVTDWLSPSGKMLLLVEQRNLSSLIIPVRLVVTGVNTASVLGEKLFIFVLKEKKV